MTVPVSNMTAQFANTDYRYDGIGMDANTFGQADGSTLINLKANGESKFTVDIYGNANTSGVLTANTIVANTINLLGSIIIGSPDSDISAANSAFIDNTIYSNNVRANTINAGTLNVTSILISGRQTIWVPVGAMVPGETAGPESNTWYTSSSAGFYTTLDFDGTTQQYAQFNIQMPKSWNESTDMYAQFVWDNPSSSASNMVWGIGAQAMADSDTLAISAPTYRYVADACGTVRDVWTSNEINFTVGGSPAAEEFVAFIVTRATANGTDTYTGLAQLHGVKLHYTTDTTTDD